MSRMGPEDRPSDESVSEERTEHPRGALVFMLIYLVVLTALWLNAYMRLWQ